MRGWGRKIRHGPDKLTNLARIAYILGTQMAKMSGSGVLKTREVGPSQSGGLIRGLYRLTVGHGTGGGWKLCAEVKPCRDSGSIYPGISNGASRGVLKIHPIVIVPINLVC